MKTICKFCGWEIINSQWYNKYNNDYICDDCEMDQAIERQRVN